MNRLAIFAVALMAGGCLSSPEPGVPVFLSDSLGAIDTSIGAPATPRYATGTKLSLFAWTDGAPADLDIVSEDEQVLRLATVQRQPDGSVFAEADALSPGSSVLRALAGDRVAAEIEVFVEDTTRVTVTYTRGLIFVLGDELRILSDNENVFVLGYATSTSFLYGFGLVRLASNGGAASRDIVNNGTDLVEILNVKAPVSGSYDIDFDVGGATLNTLEVIAVAEGDTRLEIDQDPAPVDGMLTCPSGRLLDDMDRGVFAETVQWNVAGTVVESDNFCYTPDSSAAPSTATLTFGPFMQSIEIRGELYQ